MRDEAAFRNHIQARLGIDDHPLARFKREFPELWGEVQNFLWYAFDAGTNYGREGNRE